MVNKWVAAVGYAVLGLFLGVTPIFLVETLSSPSSLLQYAGGGLLVGLALGTVGELDAVTNGNAGRGLAVLGVVLGIAGLVGQFVLL